MFELVGADKIFIDKLWVKTEIKIKKYCTRLKDTIPYLSINGKYDEYGDKKISWWTNGFYPGILWLMNIATGDCIYKNYAEAIEKKLDSVLFDFDEMYHDVGFMWLTSAVTNYRQTNNSEARNRGLLAANILAGRYNIKGNFIRAWNDWNENEDNKGWAIIDCMMNIPILHWASNTINDKRFSYIAEAHADTAMKYFVREDGSVNHIVEFNPTNGDFVRSIGGQGYCEGSSWSRGQAWAIYGFALSYKYTSKIEYLETAKMVSEYFISQIKDDYIPRCDFRQPHNPNIKDGTAGVIAASGFLEIAKHLNKDDARIYIDNAIKILKVYDSNVCDWSDTEEAIITNGTVKYHDEKEWHVPIIYGDYYFLETVLKLKGFDIDMW